ncbi:hypothetical protein QR680_011609 [Steinernema hermaphroditum]|uniref:Phosphatidylinositol transfer protein N-terminal domain-containing protein n=1 Tax=Steinernema hermaphroditum TaxID=289476 RepID=A0AA39I1Q7_9BILA|nr:hypothetical protein QR680_011609 [Steinernema hermaphroditum]
MLIKEYRIPLPLGLDEYRRGQLYAMSEASKAETGGGEGVEVLKSEPFTSTDIRKGEELSGIYTKKIYRIKNKLPWFIRKVLPDSVMVLEEECWNAYPYSKTIVTNPCNMKNDFYMIIESMHIADSGETDNALDLSKKLLKQREVVLLDIYDDKYLNKRIDIRGDTDPRKFRSRKTGRGPLTPDWIDTAEPMMCCYKVVQGHFKWFGLQNRVERLIHKQYPRLFTRFHREVFCWIDRWYHLTMDDIREMEEETAEHLRSQLNEGPLRGMVCDTSERDRSRA